MSADWLFSIKNSSARCPICDQYFPTDIDTMEHTVMEESGACSCGAYRFEYITGNTRERIGLWHDDGEVEPWRHRMAILITRWLVKTHLWPIVDRAARQGNRLVVFVQKRFYRRKQWPF